MAFSVSYIYEIRDKYTRVLDNINKKTGRFQELVRGAQRKAAQFGATLQKVGDKVGQFGQELTTKFTLVAAAAATMSIRAAADFEKMTIGFGVMLGGAERGKKLFQDLVQFSARTPFQLPGINKAAKTLLAFGVANENIINRLGMLGDIAAGTDQPLADIAQIFGKIKTKGKAMTEEILQLSERGVPIIDVLARDIQKKFGGSLDRAKQKVFKMAEKSRISFNTVLKAMQKMTGEGGKFNKMMDLQSATFAGLWSTFMDNIKIASAEVGQFLIDTFDLKGKLAGAIEWIKTMVAKFKEFTKANPELAKMITIVVGLVAVLGPLLLVMGPLIKAAGFLFSGFGGVSLVMVKVAAVVALLVAMFARWQQTNHPVLQSLRRLWEALEPLKYVFGFLIDRLAALMRWLFGTKQEAGALAHVFDAIGLALIPIIDGITALIQLMTGDTEGAKNTWAGMLESLQEFREGSSMVAQVYDGMVKTISEWITKIDNFFTNLINKVKNFVEEVKNTASVLAKTGMFGGFVQTLTNKIGEDTGAGAAEAKGGKLAVAGNINVMAGGGAKVNNANIQLNQGNNLATIGQ
jgi:gas vesicle protein